MAQRNPRGLLWFLWAVGWASLMEAAVGGDASLIGSLPGAAFLLAMLLWAAVELRGLHVTRATVHLGADALLVVLAAPGLLLAVWDAARWHLTPWGPWLSLIGAGLMGDGILLRWWAMGTLGTRFTAHVETRPGLPLVTEGPYAHVRHPGYLAGILIFAGGPLLLQSVVGAILSTAGFLVFLVVRLRREEAALHAAHGAAWETYAARTPPLLPRLGG